MGIFRKVFEMFSASVFDNSASSFTETSDDAVFKESCFDDSSSSFTETDYGINPSTGLQMLDSTFDVGGYFWGESDSSGFSDDSIGSGFSDSFSSGMFDD